MTSQGSLGEFGRIERFFRPLARGFAGALSLTDDAALIAVSPGQELAVTTDAVVAGVHFLASDAPGDIARKALRVNLSDLSAKGARPLAYTLTLALPREVSDRWVEGFAAGLAADQDCFGIALAGGDSVSTDGPVWVSITAFGLVDAGRMIKRSGAIPGDRIWVTGTIGDAALGLAMIETRLSGSSADKEFLAGRYRLPEPRVGLAAAIARHAHAAIDVSDGLAADFGHLCMASAVQGIIEAEKVPLSPPARRALQTDEKIWGTLLSGGDDYEILFAADAEAGPFLRQSALETGIKLTEIGIVTPGAGESAILRADGKPVLLARAGWTHS